MRKLKPAPAPTPVRTVVPAFLLREDGSFLLLETTGKLGL